MSSRLYNHLNSNDMSTQVAAFHIAIKNISDHKLKEELMAMKISNSNNPKILKLALIHKLAIAAMFIFVLMGISHIMLNESLDIKTYSQEIFLHPGLTKGHNDNNLERAVLAYQNQDWALAQSIFTSINPKTASSTFFAGMSAFYGKNYHQATILLSELTHASSILEEEARWYLALSYYHIGDISNMKSTIDRIEVGQWKYKEAQKIKKSIAK